MRYIPMLFLLNETAPAFPYNYLLSPQKDVVFVFIRFSIRPVEHTYFGRTVVFLLIIQNICPALSLFIVGRSHL